MREQSRVGLVGDFTNLWRRGATNRASARVVGTTLGRDHRPWLVRALGYEVEIELDRRACWSLLNDDGPG